MDPQYVSESLESAREAAGAQTTEASAVEAGRAAQSCSAGTVRVYEDFTARTAELAANLNDVTDLVRGRGRGGTGVFSGFVKASVHSVTGGFIKALAKTVSCAIYTITKLLSALFNLLTSVFRKDGALHRAEALQQIKQAAAGLVETGRGLVQSIPVAGNVILALGDTVFDKLAGFAGRKEDPSETSKLRPTTELV